MKKVGLIKLLVSLTLVASGAFAVGSAVSNKKAESVEAVAANTKVYLNTSPNTGWEDGALLKMWFKSGGNDSCNAVGTNISVKGSSDHIYMFNPTASFDSIYVERRKADNSEHWNGFDISASSTANVIKLDSSDWNKGAYDNASYNIYYETVTASSGGSAVMHLKGDSTKSGNGYYYKHTGLTLVATPNSGYHFIRWERNGTQVSSSATYTIDTIGGDYTWNAVFGHNDYTVNFYLDDHTTLYDSVPASAGETVACSKSNPTKASDTYRTYSFAGWVDSNGNAASLTNIQSNKNVYASYNITYKSGRYITGTFGSCSWGVENSVYMEEKNSQYEAEQVSLERGNKFKIAYYNGSSLTSYFGFTDILGTCGAYFCFKDDGTGNIECKAGGIYNFYFTDGDFGGGKKISIEINGSSRTAEQLAVKIMSFDNTSGTCGSRFPDMKTMYLDNLSAGEKSTFQSYASSSITEFKNAYDRYVAWAAALGQKPWELGAVGGARIVFGGNIENTNTIAIIVIISLVSVTAIGGFFFIRKRRVN